MRFALATALACLALPAFAQGQGGGGWTLISVGGTAAEPGGGIAFSADGAVFGSTGCNRFQTTAVSAPGVLTFMDLGATTRMACPGALDAQEAQVLSALKGTVGVAYDPVGERMILIPQDDAPVLGFVRAD
ncbi:META domain-containing protein [Maritimibacter sp. HL-12]|jgi:heat shock protein HslJ|uniref:META domain-containing protein n=1 Tax=Maritimibacter sp. HL-12 TaxID=1162418 RepID=UPI000A0F0F60|nr:META domain-containing protein [Maritimibacter sp. HL-12]SMH40279.1 Heat shock protein [Maritimibacter sp. HL-12]